VLVAQIGVAPEQSADVQARHALVDGSQMGVGKLQSVSLEQPTHQPYAVLVVTVSQTGVVPVHGSAYVS
jgi:hypothetical protein